MSIMAGIDETIVREYFEMNGYLVRQLNKYQVQSRKKRSDEEIDLVVENPIGKNDDATATPFVLTRESLCNIRHAVIAVRGWHTTTFTAAILSSSGEIFNFLQKSALRKIEPLFGDEEKIYKILALPALPKSRTERQKSITLMKERGVDAVLLYPNMLRDLIDGTEVNNNYVKSDLLQTLRILKNYDMIRAPQLDLFEK